MEREDAVAQGMPTLGYESRQDTRTRRAILTVRRLHAPVPALVILAWVGVIAIYWGSASLVGGFTLVLIGICVATTGIVPILFWELLIRPIIRLSGAEAPRVRGRFAIVVLYLAGCGFYVFGGLSEVVALVTRPAWVSVADYYYAQRPALAPEPRVLVLGPFVLINVDVHPHGIVGDVPGGGRVIVWFDDTSLPGTYRLRTLSPVDRLR